jgi:hypothetical protein
MLTIRSDQVQAFGSVADALFVDRVLQYLQEHHADARIELEEGPAIVQELPDEMLREFIRNGIERARAFGLTHESALAAFVVLQFETAPNFDEHPLLHRALADDRVDANQRIDRLMEKATEENWKAVKESYDSGAWYGSSQGQLAGETTLIDTPKPVRKPRKADLPEDLTDG